MIEKNYRDADNCGLETCDCSDDNSCGCSFPNNMSNYSCECADNGDCGEFSHAKINIQTPARHIRKVTTCYCNPQECECQIERSETEN